MNRTDQHDLLARFFSGEASAEERAGVESWRMASAENQRLFADFGRIWQQASEDHMRVPGVDQGWNELTARLQLPQQPVPGKASVLTSLLQKFSRSDRYIWASAAIVLLALSTFLYRGWRDTDGIQAVATGYAQQRDVELPDGSLVKLNSGSEIRFRTGFPDSARYIGLSGEAYFEVIADGRPFVIETDNAMIRVVGTKFGIWARDQETRVAVREGGVSLRSAASAQNKAVVLSANQKSVCRQSGDPEPPRTVAPEQILGWLEEKIIFDETPLVEVIAELRRTYNVPIELTNPALGARTITGTFQNKEIESVLASICLALNLQYSSQAGEYILRAQ
jgi:ferric-dicitrate binding protein FerR (iron transport regulator)